jgi:hypothetical protein
MDAKKRSFLAALVLITNGLYLLLPAPASGCGGGPPHSNCPPDRRCLPEDRCSFLTMADWLDTCNFFAPSQCIANTTTTCADSPIDTQGECDVLDSVISCRYTHCGSVISCQ